MNAHKATEEKEGPLVSLGADPSSRHWASNCARKTPCIAPGVRCRGGEAVTSPLCFLTVKPNSIFRGGHWTVHVQQVSVTHEKKLGQFLVMLLITEFCSTLNEEKVPQAISLKVGLAHACLHTHTDTPHTHRHTTHTHTHREREKKTDAKNKLCLLNCPSENQVPRNYSSC